MTANLWDPTWGSDFATTLFDRDAPGTGNAGWWVNFGDGVETIDFKTRDDDLVGTVDVGD